MASTEIIPETTARWTVTCAPYPGNTWHREHRKKSSSLSSKCSNVWVRWGMNTERKNTNHELSRLAIALVGVQSCRTSAGECWVRFGAPLKQWKCPARMAEGVLNFRNGGAFWVLNVVQKSNVAKSISFRNPIIPITWLWLRSTTLSVLRGSLGYKPKHKKCLSCLRHLGR